MDLYILKYNNYYNRTVKVETSYNGYESYIIYSLPSTNFNPNDGVDTQHLIGTGDYDGTGDYLIAVDEYGTIKSRWFIIDTTRTRGGQHQLQLRRDLIADYYNIIVSSPMFIEKATLQGSNPLLFNDEDITVNQIKTREYLLKDKSDCAWLVGYYDRNKISEMNGTVPTNTIMPGAIILDEDIENWEYYPYSTGSEFKSVPTSQEYKILTVGKLNDGSYTQAWGFYINSEDGSVDRDDESWSTRPSLSCSAISATEGDIQEEIEEVVTDNNNQILNAMNQLVGDYADITTQQDFEEFYNFNGKLVRDAQGRYYAVSVIENTSKQSSSNKVEAGSLFEEMSKIVRDSRVSISGTPNTKSFSIELKYTTYTMLLVRQENLETKYNIAAGAIKTVDSPWNMFAIPYGTITVNDVVNGKQLVTTKEISIATAMGMQQQKPSIIYDIQLLPYCPVPGLLTGETGNISVDNATQFSYITSGDGESEEDVGIIFNVPSSVFSNDIFLTVKAGTNSITKKLNNQCDKWRLTASNYSSYFDFNVEKNGGIQYFNIDCNYKPFTPYIHINPNFGNLYGYDDNSPRGLVLGGDFSLSQIIDQWQQYQIQNKNFQNIFDRQIQNMEITNKYQRLSDQISGITGTVSGITSGAFAGGVMSGGGLGSTVAGGLIGGIASGIGGVADYRIKERLRNEALDYTKDLFGYQLGNIQALPQTISKVSAFNNNNKIFPILEYYTCTDVEKEAFVNKIAYNGMTVMTIGTIENYVGNYWTYRVNNKLISSKGYVKGKLIRFESDGEDFHIVNSIAEELNKGVYLE